MPNILFIGKDLPDGLEIAESLAASGRKVFASSKSGTENADFSFSTDTENILSADWNKTSAVSARSLIIKAETELKNIDEVLFYFDANYFAAKFESDKTEEIANAVDAMICSYFYMICELLKRIDKKKEKITVAFLVKEYPSKFESCFSKSVVAAPASSVVSAAQAAFVSASENFSARVANGDFLSVLLAKCSMGNEFYKNEKFIGGWVASALDAIKSAKNRQTVKSAGIWNKVGGKISSGFSLFK